MAGVVKRSVSIDAAIWDELSQHAGPGEISALLNEALVNELRRRRGLAAVRRYESKHGPISAAALAKADAILDAGRGDLR